MEQLRVQRVIDPRVDVVNQDNRVYNVLEGARNIGYQQIPTNGGVSNTQMNWTINVPSRRTFMNRRIMLSMTFRLDFAGASAGPLTTLLQAAGTATDVGVSAGNTYRDAPRAYPLTKAIQSMQFQIQNDNLGQNVGLYWGAFNRYSNYTDSQELWHGMTPTMLDQSQTYAQLSGFARDPLREYGDNPLQVPRGGFVGTRITSNTALGAGDTASVILEVTEMLDISPFLFEKDRQDVALIGVQNCTLTINLGGKGTGALSGLASSLWSHSTAAGAGTFTSVTATVTAAELKVSFLTPDETLQIPRSVFYSYFDTTFYPQTQSAPQAPPVPPLTGETTYPLNNIQLNSIPSRLLLWVGIRDQDYNISSTDCYYNIKGVQVTFDNMEVQLSSASEQDLYQIAVKNGCNLSWTQWHKQCGSVLALDFGEDIALRTTQAPGMRGNFNLLIKVTCVNLGTAPTFPQINLAIISEGVLSITDGNVMRNLGVLNQTDVLNSKESHPMTFRPRGSVYGGAWWDDVFGFLKRVGRPVLDVARTVVPALYPAAGPVLEGVSKVGQAVGIGLKGGRRISRRQLQKMM